MRRVLPSLLIATFASGCLYTQARGEAVEAELRKQRETITTLDAQINQQRETLEAENREAAAKVGELREVIREATEIVTRNSADVGADVEILKARLAQVEGLLEELKHQLETSTAASAETRAQLEAQIRNVAIRAGVEIELSDAEVPQGADAHFTEAKRTYDAGDLGFARALLRAFITRYPRDVRLEDVRFLLADAYLRDGRPQNALGAFQDIVRHHRSGKRMADTLAGMAQAFSELGSCPDAKAALEALVAGHPRSPHVPAAKAELKAIGQGKGRCQR
jgi:TolA-binding protein